VALPNDASEMFASQRCKKIDFVNDKYLPIDALSEETCNINL